MLIGNDIVDLKGQGNIRSAQSSRYLEKVFNGSELARIQAVENKEEMIWLLWSCKESAYKVWIKQGHKRFFKPKEIHVGQLELSKDGIQSEINIQGLQYYCLSNIVKGYVHSIASDQSINKSAGVHKIIIDSSNEHRPSKILIQELYSKSENLSIDSQVVKYAPSGYPFLIDIKSHKRQEISFSHDGKYRALTYLIPGNQGDK